MAHCIFVHKADSIYDDIPAVRYQFPAPYLARARQCAVLRQAQDDRS